LKASTRGADADRCQRVQRGLSEEEHDGMHATEIQDYARRLLEAHGTKAIAEAAQKACACEQQGDKEQAQTWRRIEAALLLMRGPNEK
jgi:hypothetical protein